MTDPGAPRRRTARQRTRSRPGRPGRAETTAQEPAGSPAAPVDPAPPASSPPPKAQPGKTARGRARTADPAERDRGLRELVGAGPSQVGVSRALRARDLNRPTADDLAAAEAEVAIVRRYWQPKN